MMTLQDLIREVQQLVGAIAFAVGPQHQARLARAAAERLQQFADLVEQNLQSKTS